MSKYQVPKEYYFRLHHVRPRFKADEENVLIYFSERIVEIGKQTEYSFREQFRKELYEYPDNRNQTLKTIDNWRTEIASLFGFVQYDNSRKQHVSKKQYAQPGLRAIELAEKQDLVEFFKCFLFTFQYPGGHVTASKALEMIKKGVHFKLAQYIIRLLKYANRTGGNSYGISKGEACHCIFNDLRVTRDSDSPETTWNRICNNRSKKISYNMKGDVIRYAGDILDYMVAADLLKTYDENMYYLNTLEEEALQTFAESKEWFSLYDNMIATRKATTKEVQACSQKWIEYVNCDLKKLGFSTNLLAFIASDKDELSELESEMAYREAEFEGHIQTDIPRLSKKDIGDMGESLVHGHECMRVKTAGREDLVHLIKYIPSQYAIGYDVNSVEVDERKRFIEVKTTVSSKPLHFNKVHLTINEWNTARSTLDRYYIYRLLISKKERKLFLLQNPYMLSEQNKIKLILVEDGADITFNPSSVGEFEELLTWKN